ncbi:MAG TPA: hypothetical protein DCR44_06300 [Acholeplasmatales bacterium]|nr:hypothetical protein [Acholeplasmatales bacterium]
MAWWETVLVAFGLAMDAFAVSVCKGVIMRKAAWKNGLLIGFVFGVFQFAMPVAGYFLGSTFSSYVTEFDHWIAFGLLLAIGIKMLVESFRADHEACDLSLKATELLGLGVATSIDALAVGLSLSFLETDILAASAVIGVITFGLSFFGFILGRRIGSFIRRRAGFFGGLILIFIGVRILFEHLAD